MAISILRTIIIYTALLISMRMMGKRQLGEMELSEFVVASLIADLASHPLQDVGIPMINGLVPIVTLFCCELLIAGLTLKSVRLRSLLFGKPSMLIVRGQICQKEMRANRFTADELMQELRNQGIFDISQVEYAILETDGQLNVIPFPAEQPPTARQLGVTVADGGFPAIVVNDGRVLDQVLQSTGHDRKWLDRELNRLGFTDAKNVYLMTVNRGGQVYAAGKEAGA
ncbi:MAG: DUF421 domain-containing protein [Oscillospiraceae bacterium]|nr:DUF421 domain-containing protein [Oscillospiraceae bacterium]